MRYIWCVLCFVVAFTVNIVKGQESKQREIVLDVEGVRVLSKQQLLDAANKCLAKYHPQSRYEPAVLNNCLNSFLRCHGYLRAEIGKPQMQEVGDGVKVTVQVEEGMRYRLGAIKEIKIEGPKLFSPAQLVEMLALKPGDVADYGTISEWLDGKVKRAYADRGHIQYFHDLEPDFRPTPAGESEGVVDFKLEITEGRPFTVRRIEFAGNKGTPDHVLRSALLIKEGDTFNQSLYEDSIKNLNRLGLFEGIDKDKDVKFAAPDRVPELDLIIRVKERARP